MHLILCEINAKLLNELFSCLLRGKITRDMSQPQIDFHFFNIIAEGYTAVWLSIFVSDFLRLLRWAITV